jgi:hypothetical protein
LRHLSNTRLRLNILIDRSVEWGVNFLLNTWLDNLGGGGGGDLNEVKMLELLMGDDLGAIMDVELQNRHPSLRKVMEQLDGY